MCIFRSRCDAVKIEQGNKFDGTNVDKKICTKHRQGTNFGRAHNFSVGLRLGGLGRSIGCAPLMFKEDDQ